MLKKDFWYDLPKELIAQEPADPRDSARLMVLDRKNDTIEHRIFHDLPEYLNAGDVLVVNNSKVLPARLMGVKVPTGAVCEVLLLRQAHGDTWECLARPGRQVLGLTRGTAVVSFQTRIVSYVAPDGRWECASPQLTLTYGFEPLTVYVAREFPPGSCAHKEIYEHEMRHVETYQAHLLAIEKGLADLLTARFATGKVWRSPAGQIAGYLQRELDERWIPYIQREIAKVEAAQALGIGRNTITRKIQDLGIDGGKSDDAEHAAG